MTKQTVAANLAVQKTRLAKKYEHKALISNSRPNKVRFARQAARYRRQAETATLLSKT
jgi:hypothetical protein